MTLDKIQIGSETGFTAAEKLNKAIDAINHLLSQPIVDKDYIKIAYESNADTNAFTDAEKTKLNTIDMSTKVDKVSGKGLTEEEFTTGEKAALADLSSKSGMIQHWGMTGWDLSENNFDNNYKYLVDTSLKTTDAHLPVSPSNKLATMADLGTAGGGGGGATTLAALVDTDVTGVKDADVLVYEALSGKWKPSAGGTGGGNFDPTKYYTKAESDLKYATKTQVNGMKVSDLADFFGTPGTDQILQYDGTHWVPKTLSKTTIGGTF